MCKDKKENHQVPWVIKWLICHNFPSRSSLSSKVGCWIGSLNVEYLSKSLWAVEEQKGKIETPETIPTKISLRRIHSARITFETQWKYCYQRRQYSNKNNPSTFLCWSVFPALSRRFKHVCCSLVVIYIWFGALEIIAIPTPHVSFGKHFLWLNMTEPPSSMRSAV